MRRLIVAAVLVGLATGGYLLWSASGGRAAAPRWVTATIDRGPISATVTATGTVNPVTTVTVGSYVSGPIQAIFADFNDRITKGQLLARIDPRPFQVRVEAAEADVANARARLAKTHADADLRRATLRRQRALAATGVTSRNDLDVAESDARQAEAQITLDESAVHAAEARLSEARVNLAYTDIVSPVDGVVVARNVAVGQTVAASFQTPTLFQVAGDLTQMLVDASVSESDIGAVVEEQDATFTVDAWPGLAFHGRVAQVRNAPATVQNVVTYSVIVTAPNPERKLKPGMTANVTIVLADRPDALRVPTSALRFRPPGAAVTTVESGPGLWTPGTDGAPRRVAVHTGIADDRFTEVTDGVAAGDVVITALAREAQAPAGPQRGPSFAPARRAH
ncbi:MAG: efflux RND transporter periplasmic adaptor subunit [Candidatus Binatia bacterium]